MANNWNVFSHGSENQMSEIRILAGFIPFGNAEGESILCFFLPSESCWQSWHCLVCRHTTSIFASIIKQNSPWVSVLRFLSSYKDVSHWLGPTLIQHDVPLSWFHLQKSFFQIKVTFWRSYLDTCIWKTPSLCLSTEPRKLKGNSTETMGSRSPAVAMR